MFSLCLGASAQDMTKKAFEKRNAIQKRVISSSLPAGYSRIGTTDLYWKETTRNYWDSYHNVDVIGKYNNQYYGSTYSDLGYSVAIKVGSNSAQRISTPTTGTTISGVKLVSQIEAMGTLCRMVYRLTNTTSSNVTISLGVHGDVMIGNVDKAPITRRTDTEGNTYGLTMADGNGAKFCVLFGKGLSGVTSVDDFWFGTWSLNHDASQIVGNYSSGGDWMVENGSYDSGMGWCWKNRVIPAGETLEYAYILGVGEVNLEPKLDFDVTLINTADWNDLTKVHNFTVDGTYESPFNQPGYVEYAVEDNDTWTRLNDTPISSGSGFSDLPMSALFNNASTAPHKLRFRTSDVVGNVTNLPSLIFEDIRSHEVTGFVDMVYTGAALAQTNLSHDYDDTKWATSYTNNVNAGTAYYHTEGIYEQATIGKRSYSFTVNPQPLSGAIAVTGTYSYTGSAIVPTWNFTNPNYSGLVENTDYTKQLANNIVPGTASLSVTGINNYTGTLSTTFTINKGAIDGKYHLTLPPSVIAYDGNPHGASVTTDENVGTATLYYTTAGMTNYSTTQPILPGSYDIYLEIEESAYYYGLARTKVGSFTITKKSPDYTLTLPSSTILYDGLPHGASVTTGEGVGVATLYYTTGGQTNYSTDQPVMPGSYDIYLEIAASDICNGLTRTKVGSFSIITLPVDPSLYTLILPASTIPYDSYPHGASITTNPALGTATLSYTTAGMTDYSTDQPVMPGSYDIYLEIAPSAIYDGLDKTKVGSFTITKLDVTPADYTLTLPASSIEYDGHAHGASVVTGGNYGGIGTATLYYTTAGQTNYSTTQPTMPGSYDIYIEVDENDIYNPLDKTKVGSFTINPALDDNTLVMDANDDNTDILDDNTGENKDVTINNLTIKSNKWTTLCLPFNLTSDQIEAVFGEDADLEELVSSSYDGDINELSLLFTPRTEVVAGMPYAIKVPTEVVNPTFVDVTIANTDPTTIYTTYASMTGSYSPTLLVGGDKNTLFISNNMFYYPSVSGSLAGTKCWFNLLGEAHQGPARPRLMSVRMNMKDNNTTAIMKVTASGREFSDAVYNLQGVRVSNPTKGIYIRNGVKMIVK